MTKQQIFEELVSIRTIIEKNDEDALVVDQLQDLIWKLGQDIGEF